MKVELIDWMGSDDKTVDGARVSFDKRSEMFPKYKNDGLINFLSREVHWAPFAHAMVSFRIQAPIFSARQLWKSHIGLATQDEPVGWNEESRRYIKTEPTFYIPDHWYMAAENVKQGSSLATITKWDEGFDIGHNSLIYNPTETVEAFFDLAKDLYMHMLDQGHCPEQARGVLPQAMYTQWIWTGSVYAFARICNLRQEAHSQKDTKIIADKIDEILDQAFPVSWQSLREQDRLINIKPEEKENVLDGILAGWKFPDSEEFLKKLESLGYTVAKKRSY